MKFRKKPVEIEAFQWPGIGHYDFPAWMEGKWYHGPLPEKFVIKTLEGNFYANKGDWIIRGVKGEVYPCKPDIFETTYEAVGEEPPKER